MRLVPHARERRRSTGTIGPNLDDAFASDKEQGFSLADDGRRRARPDRLPRGPDAGEPRRGPDADDVSVYVAKCAANPTCGVTAATRQHRPRRPPAPTTTSAGGSPTALGKQVFASAGCGGCHTLKDAGSTGNVGPNLDQLKPSEATVAHQVEIGGGPMPAFKGQLSPAQIQAVAELRQRRSPGKYRASGAPQTPALACRGACRARGRAGSPRRSRRRRARSSRSSHRSCAPSSTPVWVESSARSCGWRRQELGEQGTADAAPLPATGARAARRPRSAAGRATARAAQRQRPRDVLGPPLVVRAGVAVPEPGELRAALAPRGRRSRRGRHGVASRFARPVVRQRARAERGAVDLAQLGRAAAADRPARRSARGTSSIEIDDDVGDGTREPLARLLDDAALQPVRPPRRMASRRSARPAGTCAARPRSPGSGRRRRSRRSRRARRRASRRDSPRGALLRRPVPRPRPRSSGERRVERRADDQDAVWPAAERARISARSSGPPTVSFATTRMRRSPAGARRRAPAAPAPRRSRRRKTSQTAPPPVSTTNTASPSHESITEPITISAEVADRQQDEPERVAFAPERVPHGARGGRPSRRRRST